MINTEEFRNMIRDIVRQEIGDPTRYKIGEIASVGDKVQVKFSGEQVASQKEYTFLKSYYPIVGDRVLLARDKGTYVVLGKLFGSIAGYIIESGSNNNGNYVKFSDGTMICHTAGSKTLLYGSIYFLQYEWFFPVPFVDTSICISVNISIPPAGTRGDTYPYFRNTTTNRTIISLYNNGGRFVSDDSAVARPTAIGRWK